MWTHLHVLSSVQGLSQEMIWKDTKNNMLDYQTTELTFRDPVGHQTHKKKYMYQ